MTKLANDKIISEIKDKPQIVQKIKIVRKKFVENKNNLSLPKPK